MSSKTVLLDDEALRARAEACAREVAAREQIERDAPDRDALERILQAFAAGGLFDLGYLHGGGELAPRDMRVAARTCEGIGRISGTLATVFQVNAVFGGAFIALAGDAAQRERLLGPLREGRLQVAFALTEPGAGSDATGLATFARPASDDDGWVLAGEKTFATGAATADRIVVVARVDGGGPRDVGLFLVAPDAPGVTVEPLPKLAGDVQASCRVALDGAPVAREDVLGEPGAAWRLLRVGGMLERITVAAANVGSATRVLERTLAHAREREQFGQPIGRFQAIAHALVEMRTDVTTMRLLLDEALATVERGEDPTAAVCTAKYVCAERLQQVVGTAMRVLGGRAYFHFEEVSRHYREAALALYAGGTIEVQKNAVARTLGLG